MNTRWLDEALKQARIAQTKGEVPVGAVVIHTDENGIETLVGTGHNDRESSQTPVSHAEIHALTEASKTLKSWRLLGCTLYVTLEPCPMCLAACQQARVDRVVYGATDPKGGALSLGYRLHEDAKTNHLFKAELVEIPECSEILSAFFKSRRQGKTP